MSGGYRIPRITETEKKYFLYCQLVCIGAIPSGGSRRTRQYVQNPEELDSMPTISGGEADGGVGIESSSEGFWTYCLVGLEPTDGIDIVNS